MNNLKLIGPSCCFLPLARWNPFVGNSSPFQWSWPNLNERNYCKSFLSHNNNCLFLPRLTKAEPNTREWESAACQKTVEVWLRARAPHRATHCEEATEMGGGGGGAGADSPQSRLPAHRASNNQLNEIIPAIHYATHRQDVIKLLRDSPRRRTKWQRESALEAVHDCGL